MTTADDFFLDWRAEIATWTPEPSYRVTFDVASSGEMGPAGKVVLTVIAVPCTWRIRNDPEGRSASDYDPPGFIRLRTAWRQC